MLGKSSRLAKNVFVGGEESLRWTDADGDDGGVQVATELLNGRCGQWIDRYELTAMWETTMYPGFLVMTVVRVVAGLSTVLTD